MLSARLLASHISRRSPPLPSRRPFSSVVSSSTRLANLGVAGLCGAFCVGVWYYSVQAVGGPKKIKDSKTGEERGGDEFDELERIRKINIHRSGELKVEDKK